MHERRLRTLTAPWGRLVLAAWAVLGCPQMLRDDFLDAPPLQQGEGGSKDLPDLSSAGATSAPPGGAGGAPSSAGAAGSAAGEGGSAAAGASGSNAGGAAGSDVASSGSGGIESGGAGGAVEIPPTPDAGSSPDAGSCVASTELCDGLDNDCDDQIDQGGACPSNCAGVVILGRGYMYCGGAGETPTVAETRCDDQGMRLVRVESAQENAAIVSAVGPLYTSLPHVTEDQSSIWMAALDSAVEGTWRWGAAGTIFWLGNDTGAVQNGAYENWSTGKPNNNGNGAIGEDCGVMYVGVGAEGSVGEWNDLACDTVHSFLCEQTAP